MSMLEVSIRQLISYVCVLEVSLKQLISYICVLTVTFGTNQTDTMYIVNCISDEHCGNYLYLWDD